MSVSKRQMDEVRLGGVDTASETDELDWVALIKDFAEQYEMQFNETLRWISGRTSLQVACEVMGIALSPSIASRYTPRDLEMLNSLGDVLRTHGCKVPRLMEHRRMEYVWKGRDTMGFSLTREEYLQERAAGKSKNKIAKQQGISGPALFHWLNKWGLKDVAVEQEEIEQLLKRRAITGPDAEVKPSVPESSSESAEKDIVIDKSQEVAASLEMSTLSAAADGVEQGNACGEDGAPGYLLYPRRKLHVVLQPSNDNEILPQKDTERATNEPHVTQFSLNAANENRSVVNEQQASAALDNVLEIHIPLLEESQLERQGLVSLPETINTKDLSRDELMQMGLLLLQEAVGRAYGDLSDLLGAGPAGQQIHQYVAHQVEKVMGKKG